MTAGSFDLDAELHVWTTLGSDGDDEHILRQHLRNGQCDVMAVHRFFTDKVLGMDTAPYTSGVNRFEGEGMCPFGPT